MNNIIRVSNILRPYGGSVLTGHYLTFGKPAGGGYIRISPDGQIEIHTPSRLSLKGQHVWNGPASEEFPLPESVCKECLEKAQANAMGAVIRE